MVRLRAALGMWLLVAAPAVAADDGLKPLSDTLTAIRATHGVNDERDAGPELTPAKARLREWIESRIGAVTFDPDAKALVQDLNKALTAGRLMCPSTEPAACIDRQRDEANGFDARGYVGDVAMSFAGRYLLIQTSVGVRCGYDESVYLYARGDGDKDWHLAFRSEQDDYRDKIYQPQNVTGVQVSPSNSATPLVLTLGISPWCQSNWQLLYTRLWRMGTAAPLVDAQDTIFLGDDDGGPAVLSDDGAIVRYDGDALGAGVRKHVVHYVVDGKDRVRRIAPVAFGPSDFVDEWLHRPWPESAGWIVKGADVAALHKLHAAARGTDGYVSGGFDDPAATHCRTDPSLWQVAATIGAEDGPKRFFLVRWMAPYRFALKAVRDKPMPHCDAVDSLIDNPN